MSKRSFRIIGGIFFLIGLVTLAGYWWTRPTILRLAISASNNEAARFSTAFAYKLRQEGGSVRVRVTMRNSMEEVVKSLENGEVDMAIVRNDYAFPQNTSLVAIMQRNPLLLLTPQKTNINKYADLAYKRVGVVTRNDQAPAVLERILREFEVNPASVTMVKLTPAEVPLRTISDNLDAIFINSPAESAWAKEAEQAYSFIYNDKIRVVPIAERDAIAKRVPYIEPFNLVQGAFGGNPPRPAEAVRTSSTSLILLASNDIHEEVIGELTEELFQRRAALAIEHPVALRIQAPDVEINASFPVHAGAYAHFTDTRQTLLERYSDALYIGLMVISLIGTLVAGFFGVKKAALYDDLKHEEPLEFLASLLKSVPDADAEKLESINPQLDKLLITCLEDNEHNSNSARLSVILSTIDRVKAAVNERTKL